MLLGTILKQLSDESSAAAILVDIGDLLLINAVETTRQTYGESVGDYVSGATRRFANEASKEDWMRLTTALERSDTPASTCLKTMLTWALAQDGAPAPTNE